MASRFNGLCANYSFTSSEVTRRALKETDSITKSSSGSVKLQLSNFTPKTITFVVIVGTAGFFRLNTMLKTGWGID